MLKKPSYFALALIIILLSLVPVWYFSPRVTVAEVDEMIKRELPLGSTKPQVLTFLQSRHIEYLDLMYRSTQLKFISAVIPDVQRGFLSKYEIDVFFYVNDEGKLIDYKVERVKTIGHSVLGI